MFLSQRGEVFYIRYRDEDAGSWQKFSTYLTSPTQAATLMQNIGKLMKPTARKAREPQPPAGPSTTLHDLRKSYLEYSRANHAPRTTAKVESCINRFTSFTPSTTPLAEITTARIEQFKQSLVGVIKPVSVNSTVRQLKALFRYAHRMEMMERDVFKGVKFLKTREETNRSLTRQQFKKLLAAAATPLHRRVMEFAVNTGLRRGELTRLQWQDIDFSSRLLTVRAAHAKSGKSRKVPLNAKALFILMALPEAQPGDRVFPIADSDLSRVVTVAREKAGLPGWIHLHSLRHTFSTWLDQAGVDIETIRRIAGHSSITTTALYLHTDEDTMRAGVDRL